MKISPLTDKKAMLELDKSNVLGSIEQLGSQVQHIWEIAQNLTIDESFKKINAIVVAGMGGSALGTHVIQSIFKDELSVPVLICPDYVLPNFVDEHTLVIASSYSGTTEETLAAVEDAKRRKAKIAGITSGGKLAEFLKNNGYPALIFEPTFNPCNQPRMALGYSVFGQIALFSRVGALNLTQDDYQSVLTSIADAQMKYSALVEPEHNPAKLLAFEFHERVPIITVSEHLEGVGHVFANQINENSKSFSEYRVIPELNHHLMEGLAFPSQNEQNLIFLTVHSDLYSKQNLKRMVLTESVLEKNNIEYRILELASKTKLSQAFEFIVFSSYTNYYMAMLNNIDPSPIPWVDWFKEQLKT